MVHSVCRVSWLCSFYVRGYGAMFRYCLRLIFLLVPEVAHAASMLDAVKQTLSYNPELKQAQEIRQRAVHDVRKAQAGYYPTLGVWAGAGINQTDSPVTRATNEDNKAVGANSMGLSLSQPLWQGGATQAKEAIMSFLGTRC